MENLHIGIYGSVNSGKSSIINKLAGQNIALVSDTAGTTTDAVKKTIELIGIGPSVLIDTAGINDATSLGPARSGAAMRTLDIIDMAIIVADGGVLTRQDLALIKTLPARGIPFFIINNKNDKPDFKPLHIEGVDVLPFSALKEKSVENILTLIKKHKPAHLSRKQVLLDDIVKQGDIVILVCPIDSAAPKGRLILPQVNVLRNILDNRASAVVLQVSELADFLKLGLKIKLVVTDSQAFKEVSDIVPPEIPLTSFSIVFARIKGDFELYLRGVKAIDLLKDGDKVLILESCTHSANTCEDIGRVKLPNLIRKKSGKNISFTILPNLEKLPEDLNSYALAVQCGGCMVTRSQIMTRLNRLAASNVPVTNYGIAIAHCTGILQRVTRMFLK
ncbi:MAG: [FeFe] hydrogenase H-cluster maturation GTPase HydF [Elusimicrobiota bacterium]|jgi:[FeFe] hydrogenase H-cluster maturation GTPase HydF|nr:[FeFe] hydrogenase H-cluster maturation GTPase HydF [Elusimicrobiota bacterium]